MHLCQVKEVETCSQKNMKTLDIHYVICSYSCRFHIVFDYFFLCYVTMRPSNSSLNFSKNQYYVYYFPFDRLNQLNWASKECLPYRTSAIKRHNVIRNQVDLPCIHFLQVSYLLQLLTYDTFKLLKDVCAVKLVVCREDPSPATGKKFCI